MTELEYQEHIRHTHNAFCRIVIRHAAINMALRLRKQWQKDRHRRKFFNIISSTARKKKSARSTGRREAPPGGISSLLYSSYAGKWRNTPMKDRLLPYETIVKAREGDPAAIQAVLDRYAGYIRFFSRMDGQYNADMADYIIRKLIESQMKFRLDR